MASSTRARILTAFTSDHAEGMSRRLARNPCPSHNASMTLRLDESGWHAEARIVRSPNFNDRPPGTSLSLIVVHNISLPPGEYETGAVEELFCNTLDCGAHPFYRELEGLRVSSHFLIGRNGALTQFVSCADRAWHAGRSAWAGRPECNDYSVGIELEGTDTAPYAPAQYTMLAALINDLRKRYEGLSTGAIAAHSDIAPGRKTDPGPAFRWDTLRSLLRDPTSTRRGDSGL